MINFILRCFFKISGCFERPESFFPVTASAGMASNNSGNAYKIPVFTVLITASSPLNSAIREVIKKVPMVIIATIVAMT